MGIAGIWSLLNAVKKEISLKECKGKRIAVDLSAWIVPFGTATDHSQSSPSKGYLACRGIFFRAINLSELGILPVFVIDGPQAPTLKGRFHREDFYRESLEYKRLLTAMGFLVLDARGEAEKMCAELNQKNLVDGVLTSDGDALVYGAKVVFKGIFTDKRELRANKYTMKDVQTSLHMNQRDLVAFALLSKGDISDGVKSVGEKTFLSLFTELKRNGVEDCLERLKSWSSNGELGAFEEKMKQTPEKASHCNACLHQGTKSIHKKSGCSVCDMKVGCSEALLASQGSQHPACPCLPCDTQRITSPHSHELKIRSLALQQNKDFPQPEIMDEFLVPNNTLPDLEKVCMRLPNYTDIHKIMNERVGFTADTTAKHLIPWTIRMALHGILPDVQPEPLKIVKMHTLQFEKCCTVQWKKLDVDNFPCDTNRFYEFPVAEKLFALGYQDMVREFELKNSAKKNAKKRAKDLSTDSKQRSINDFFKVSKKASVSVKNVAH